MCAISRGGLRSIARYVYDVQYSKVRSLQLAFRKPFKVMVEYTTVCTEYTEYTVYSSTKYLRSLFLLLKYCKVKHLT